MKYLPDSKRSQSEVISTVLLILIGVVAVTVVAAFAINFVNNQIEKSKCFDVVDLVEIKNNPSYTCFKSRAPDTTSTLNSYVLVQVHFSDTKSSLEGFVLEIGGADTETFKIPSDEDRISMYSGVELTLPGDNAEKTYKITGYSNDVSSIPKTIKVHPILKGGKICQSASSVSQLPSCP